MDIAMVTAQFADVGGVENVVREISKRLSQDHSVSLVTREREQNTDTYADYFDDVHEIPGTASFKDYMLKGREFFRANDGRFDVFHFHNWSTVFPATVIEDSKTVLTLHGTSTNIAREHQNWLRLPGYWVLEQAAVNIPDVVTSVTHSHLKPFWIWPEVRVIRNGVDTERFRPRPEQDEELREKWNVNGQGILIVGNHVENKGHQTLIRACAKLDREYTLMVPGTGPLTEELEQLVEQLDVDAEFYGYVEEDELPELYNAADLFCLPSWGEGLPLSILEAMSSGLPVVVSDVGDNRRIVEEADAGDVIDNSARDLTQTLASFNATDQQSKNSRFYAEKINWRSIANQYERLFEEVSTA